MLVVLPSSQGICALMAVGETITSGAAMPLKYTWVPPSEVGKFVLLVSAEAVCNERFVPCTCAMVPGARDAASPPPERLAPLVVPVMPAVVARLQEAGVRVAELTLHGASLDEVFLSLTGRRTEDEANTDERSVAA